MTYTWEKIPLAVVVNDGKLYRIYRLSSEQQEEYYSGHWNYHAINSKVTVDNEGKIRYTECGFLGHLNDSQQFALVH